MKDFAKSIVCNTKAEVAKVGNVAADITSDGNTWFVTTSDGKKKEFTSEREAEEYVKKVKSGNSKCGNAYQYAGSIPIEKIPDNWRPEFPKAGYVVYYAPNKAKWFATEAEAKRFAESQDKAQKTGNSKVGNADKFSGNYIIMSDDGDVWFRDEHEDVSIRSIDSWAQKRIAEYQRSINEIQKGVQEAKQAAKKFGLL